MARTPRGPGHQPFPGSSSRAPRGPYRGWPWPPTMPEPPECAAHGCSNSPSTPSASRWPPPCRGRPMPRSWPQWRWFSLSTPPLSPPRSPPIRASGPALIAPSALRCRSSCSFSPSHPRSTSARERHLFSPEWRKDSCRYASVMAFERPAPDLAKLISAWEAWEKGEENPGKVLANLKTAGLADVLEELKSSGWSPAPK